MLVVIHLCGLCFPTCVRVCVYTYVCWLLPACMFSVCDWARRAHSDTRILIHTHTYCAKHPLTSRALCSAAGPLFAQSSLTAGCRRGVWWSGPGLIRLHPLSFLCVCRSHTSVHLSICLTHRLPSTNTCSHYSVYAWSTQHWLVCVCLCLCPCPDHLPPYPEPPALATT